MIVIAFFSILFWRSFSQSEPAAAESEFSEEQTIPKVTIQPAEIIGLPTHISIPSINVDAQMENVALAKDGSMDVPKDPLNTGWYELGPRPGQVGSAVIAGHLNWFQGVTGAFADLHKVQPGDTIVIHNNEGSDITFIIREIKTYDADADATDIFVSTDGKAHLNLITCLGDWDKNAQQYSERLVVFADRKEE